VLKVLKMLANITQTFCHLLFKRPHIAHFFLPQSYLMGAPLAILARTRVKLMSRRSMNNYQAKYPGFIRTFELRLHRHMTGILGNSQKVVQQLVQEEHIPAEKVHLIYNGISLRQTAPAHIRQQLGIAPGRTLLALVANLIPYKGHADLLEALAQVTHKNWDVLIIGNDSTGIRADLEHQAMAAGIADHVHFLGKRTDVGDILPECDIGLLTSHEEGFANAILEGMAAGLPMIVTDVGGNAEAVIHEKSGLVVPAHAPQDLAAAIDRLLADPALRQRYAAASSARFTENFTVETCVQAYYAYYTKLLG
jgi:glycosyltransferase involved in cell wall biosynthesis